MGLCEGNLLGCEFGSSTDLAMLARWVGFFRLEMVANFGIDCAEDGLTFFQSNKLRFSDFYKFTFQIDPETFIG